jgi:glycosyltransferase involved in cell wall biosynthesis
MRALNRATLRLERQVFAVSRAVRSMLLRQCPEIADRVCVVRNGIDAAAVASSMPDRPTARRQLAIEPDDLVLLSVGHLHAIKRHVDVIRAFARVRRVVGERAKLWIAGRDRGQRRHLEHEITSLGLGSAVVLAGPRQDVPRLLAAADVFVLASAFEGLPLALLEACASGVPVVATAVGGIPEVIEDAVHGRLVPPTAPERLAQAILDTIGDEPSTRRRADAACQRVTREFSIEDCVAGYAAAYRVLEKSPA